MKPSWSRILFLLMSGLTLASPVFAAASQDKYDLPEPYISSEKAYLKELPDLQRVMDVMVGASERQLKEPGQDVLHNRVCAALVYQMSVDNKLPSSERRLALAGDLLHNISKEEQDSILTRADQMAKADHMIARLKHAGYFTKSPNFWSDSAVFGNPKIGGNRALIHHITGAVMAGELLQELGRFSEQEISTVEAAIVEHSTGYWYFRTSVNDIVGKSDAWEKVYPEPESNIAKFTHDADLISQFVPESVVPDGSKWRLLAKKRWGAKTTQEEGHIVYYVFLRLFEEAKTNSGKEMARQQWDLIAPALVKLMGLKPGDDPIKLMGIPRVFSK